jgi:hypothetical protein
MAAPNKEVGEHAPRKLYRIYKVGGLWSYTFHSEHRASGPGIVMSRFREANPGVTITAEGAGMGRDFLVVPAESDRCARVMQNLADLGKPRTYTVRLLSMDSNGHFSYEYSTQIVAVDHSSVENKLRYRCRKDGLRARFGQKPSREKVIPADVRYYWIDSAAPLAPAA